MVIALILPATEVPAQSWFSPESCRIGKIAIDRTAYPIEQEKELRAKADTIPNAKGRFWKITAPNGAVSHLWGSYHVAEPLMLDLPTEFRAELEDARVVALEFDPSPDSRAEATRQANTDWMWQGASDGPVDRSDMNFLLEYYVKQRMTALGWQNSYYDQMTDVGSLSLLLSDPCGDFVVGVLPTQDYYIAQIAAFAGAELTGMQDYMSFTADLNDQDHVENARAALISYAGYLSPEVADPGLRETAFALYQQGRLAEMDLWSDSGLIPLLGEEQSRKIADLTAAYLIVERNHIFFEGAEPLLMGGEAVLVMGASHLSGQTGFIELLRLKGYTVDRVLLPGEEP